MIDRFDFFNYQDKSRILRWADFHNQGVYALFGGKRVVFFHDLNGDEKYKYATSRSLGLAIAISLISLPILLVTIPIKIFSLENTQAITHLKKLKQQQLVMQKLKRTIAATKIQRAFRKHIAHKQAQKPANWKLGNFMGFVRPYLPTWNSSVRFAQEMVVKGATEMFVIGSCQILGCDPSEVKMLNKTENFCAKLNNPVPGCF
ncbi:MULTISPECIES: hypothetical protein [Parachlamydia]|jgi:hypothetical protein|uniref:Uncharacterized protein n=2 Tax=Parachlamydia acanthamoebae TaxID=83552 RepID=F8L027_PARAV|nr:hypothetical protein [Parachlamydia acanthamoebae]EFB40798.1 hypothetical protein pah_c188o053 [Parachlamydia acanthamoebae str. Hall's coccus]KIA77744.1 hypothetical protein DB43_FU00200 [Parachlamydia acanthamoebae]CCB86545.1 putative uncharacterized protein [Parachlamydia acanthamoebae UV-7]